jgi:Protein kinase domain/AAA ATPase domain
MAAIDSISAGPDQVGAVHASPDRGQLATGTVFADAYRITGDATSGGMGTVYRVVNVSLDRIEALKVIASELSADEEFRERFRREMRLAASLEHPNVVAVHHAGESDGLLFLAMEYVPGIDLSRILKSEGRLAPGRAVRILEQLAAALQAAHVKGLVHRDVKPANVLVISKDGRDEVKLADFGLTTSFHSKEDLTRTGTVLGTFDYMAPEQFEGTAIDGRADVYALGCVLYEMLTGQPPFPRPSAAAVLYAHVFNEPPAPHSQCPDVPVAFDAVVSRALAKSRDARYPTTIDLAREARAALEGVIATTESQAGAPLTSEPRSISVPSPSAPRVIESMSGSFVGRVEPLALLHLHWGEVAAGAHRVVVLAGEPGVGKTRLAVRFAQDVIARGGHVLYGRCDEEALVPYQPFVEMLRDLVIVPRPEGHHDDGRAALGELSLLLGPTRDRNPEGDGGVPNRFQLFESVAAKLVQSSAAEARLLVIDDLQWADRTTLQLLAHLVRHPEMKRVMVLATSRDAATSPGDPLFRLLTNLRRDGDYEQVKVGGLDERETAELVAAHYRSDVSDAFVARLCEQTEGNPLFVEEILCGLAKDTHSAADEDAIDALDRIGVPESVAELILVRLEDLSDEARDVLAHAAVLGKKFDLTPLCTLLARPPEELLVPLEEAVVARLVDEVPDRIDEFVFAHALVHRAIYERLTASRRARLHFRIAETLEQGSPPEVRAAEVAHHLLRAGPLIDHARMVHWTVRAAEQASDSLAHEEAETWYRRALEALARCPDPDEERRCALLLDLGRTQWEAGSDHASDTFWEAARSARQRGSGDQLAAAALGLSGRYWEAHVVDEDHMRLFEEAVEALPAGPTVARAELLARLAQNLHFRGDLERSDRVSHEAVSVARRVAHAPTLAKVLTGRHVALLAPDHVHERASLTEEALLLTTSQGEIAAEVRQWRLYDLFELGRIEEAREEYDHLVAMATELRSPRFRHLERAWQGVFALLEGRLDEAERVGQEARAAGRRAQISDAATIYVAQLVSVRLHQARAEEAVEIVESLPAEYGRLAPWRAARILARLNAGDHAGARDLYEPWASGGLVVPRDFFWMPTTAMLAEACSAFSDVPGAAVLYDRLQPFSDLFVQVGFAACWGSVNRYLGMLAGLLGRREEAVARLREAVDRHERCGAPLLAAQARADLAQAEN